ncbi:conserved Plasmodium protein, unknown function [Plasmodium malariae]|uniref:Allantoicase domain-containing protein n=1 Tax=Plasmodium malariae TaxID=5858 RepID=A0A1C3K9U8_PLAMA|nr:conserved Plasmodium protein, unknown function [Plasmodium malariae]
MHNFNKEVNGKRLSVDKNLKEIYENINNNIRSFNELLSEKNSDKKRKIITSDKIDLLNDAPVNNYNYLIEKKKEKSLISYDTNALNDYYIDVRSHSQKYTTKIDEIKIDESEENNSNDSKYNSLLVKNNNKIYENFEERLNFEHTNWQKKKYDSKDYISECADAHFENNTKGNLLKEGNSNYNYFLENSEIGNNFPLTNEGSDTPKKMYKDLDELKNQNNNFFVYKKHDEKSDEVKLLKSQNEHTSKFLYSSNDTYNEDVVKMYNNKLSTEGENKKENKLINKNMILKEIFGSNYESSLKNNLNESSNMLGDDDEEGEKEAYEEEEVNELYEAEEKEESDANEKEEYEANEKEEYEAKEKEEYEAKEKEESDVEEKEEYEAKEKEEYEAKEKEVYEAEEKGEYEAKEKDEHEANEKEKYEAKEKEESDVEEKEEYEAKEEAVYEEEKKEAYEEEEKQVYEVGNLSEDTVTEHCEYDDKKEREEENAEGVKLNEGKYNLFTNDKSLLKEINEYCESQLEKSKSMDKDIASNELGNDEDSLLKRYEENSSPLILSKPHFNDKTSDSSYNTSVIMSQTKKKNNESLSMKCNNIFLDTMGMNDLRIIGNISEMKRKPNIQDNSSGYQEEEYISKKHSKVTVEEDKTKYEHIPINNAENNKREKNMQKGEEEYYTKKRNVRENVCEDMHANAYANVYEKFSNNRVNEQQKEYSVSSGEDEITKKGNKKVVEIRKNQIRENREHSKYYTYKGYIKKEQEEENKEMESQGSYTSYNRNQFGKYDDEHKNVSTSNEQSKEHHNYKKKTISKYMDNNFLIYKDKLFLNKENDTNKNKPYLNHKTLQTHYGENVSKNKERELLFDSMSDNYNYIMRLKKSRKSSCTNFYENIKSSEEFSENKETDENIKSRVSDDNYLDYVKDVKYNSKCTGILNSDAYRGPRNDEKSIENEYILKKRKRKNIFESDSIIESKDDTNFDIPHNNSEYFNDVKKKLKKFDNINNSNISYDNSEYSKGPLYHSINETTNSSQTIVSKRSKYILKQSNTSSIYDDVPLFFNFVNCCSIVLGSEIIYVTDETYGKCENILKDKPFNISADKGYYEDCSNDLYNVLNNNLRTGIHKNKGFNLAKKENIEKSSGERMSYCNSNIRNNNNGNNNNFNNIDTNNNVNNEEGTNGPNFYSKCLMYPSSSSISPNDNSCPGWLTKRRIKKYFDFCIVKLCKPTLIKGIDIDTNNFLGNYAPYVSIEGAYIEDDILVSSESFSKYVDKIKYENKKKKKNDLIFEKKFYHHQKSNENSDIVLRKDLHETNKNNEKSYITSGNSNSSSIRKKEEPENNLFNSREEIELLLDGKTYFKRNKYFYEPILIDPLDKSDQEYENYLEILRYNDKFKNLRSNPKSTSFVANGNEYRYIDNKLYTLVDVTREIVSRYPEIHKRCSNKKSSIFKNGNGTSNNSTDMNSYQNYVNYNKEYERSGYTSNTMNCANDSNCVSNIRGNGNNRNDRNNINNRNYDKDEYDGDIDDHYEGCDKGKGENNEEEDFPFNVNLYNSNTLYLDNDYSVEKKIYNDLHKQYQWVSILEDERMNPGFKDYNHNCFNINTCNKIFTHLIVCLLPDGGINKLRVYGEIKISEKERKKNYKKTINVCNILDGSNVVYTTDEFYGKSENILIDQNSNYVMGWQTRRLINRPLRYVENLSLNNISSVFFNNNYCIIKLSFITNIKYIEINTIFYEYNFPLCISIDYCYLKEVHSEEKSKQIKFFNENIQNVVWKELLPLSYIKGNHINFFTIKNSTSSNVPLTDIISSHLRLNIYPDGGINTVKAYGTVVEI